MTDDDFQYASEQHPLMIAASRFHAIIMKLTTSKRGVPLRAMVERAARQLALRVAESIDVPEERTKLWSSARKFSARATHILGLMYTGGAIDEASHRRALQALRPVSVTLDQRLQKSPDARPVDARPADAGIVDEEPSAAQGAPATQAEGAATDSAPSPEANGAQTPWDS